MEQQQFLTIKQWYFDFDYYESVLFFDFSNENELVIKRIDNNLIENVDPQESEIRFAVKVNGDNPKERLDVFLTDLLLHNRNFYGDPYFGESNMIDKERFDLCKKKANEIIDERINKIKEAGKNHPLIRYCSDRNLYPEPEGSSPHNWQANCPSDRAHHFYISTHSSTWGCGYCKRKGGLEELKEWMKER